MNDVTMECCGFAGAELLVGATLLLRDCCLRLIVLALIILSVSCRVVLCTGSGVSLSVTARSCALTCVPVLSSGDPSSATISGCAAVSCRLIRLRRSSVLLILVRRSRPHLGSAPRRNVRTGRCYTVSCPRSSPRLASAAAAAASTAFSQLGHEIGVLGVEVAGSLHERLLTTGRSVRVRLYHAVSSHVASVATEATDDVSCEILLLRTVILAMADSTTVLANLVFIVPKGAIESGKLTKLVALMIILAFGGRGGLLRFMSNERNT